MTRAATPAARRALSLFDDAARGDRFHARVRWKTCPFPLVEEEVPTDGRVLDVGCGHGLLTFYLALSNETREVVGVDIDVDKIAVARSLAATLRPGEADVRFEVADPDSLPEGAWDAITMTDVLYLLTPTSRLALLDRCAAALAPGGVFVLKEIDRRPRWKYRLSKAQELLATRVLRITEGDDVDFLPPADLVAHLEGCGLEVTSRAIDQGYLHPHHLILARHA